jgi:hypothetical protein
MALYARSDLMSVSIPPTSGGCGAAHTRPVTRGNPVKTWKLECPECEGVLRGARKQKVIHTIPGDKNRGIAARLVHVADTDPHWSNTPEGIPLNPDEQHIHKLRAEQGKDQLDMLTAYATLKQGGVAIPEQAQWLINKTLEDIAQPILKGSLVCVSGHDNNPGAKFCVECGTSMANAGILTGLPPRPEPEEVIPLETLHVATLKKMAREQGLSDKGTKVQLIERLTS